MRNPGTVYGLLLVVACACLHVHPTDAQRTSRASVDWTTGRAAAPAGPERRPRMRPSVAGGGGEVIGYTTDAVVPHTLTLVELLDASADLIADGNTLVPVDDLSPASLSGIDRLVVGLVAQVPPEADIDAIDGFVRGGGKLVYLGEHNIIWHEENEAIGGRFGITYPLSDPVDVVLTAVAPHPITAGPYGQVRVLDGSVNAPRFFGSMESQGPYGASLVDFAEGNSAAVVVEPGALAHGSGLVVAFSDINIWASGYFLGDNRALWRNTFAYDPVPTGVVLDFETEDDFATPLVNGQAVETPGEFGRLVEISGLGLHTYGTAIFDSTPGGPNATSSDQDLLVDRGNVLILQENQTQSVPGIYDDPDDAQLGGTMVFDFLQPVRLESVVLIDVCPGPPAQDVTLTLFDQEFESRTYFVPGGWTNDLFSDGPPGLGTLDLTTLEPQPGFLATATARQSTLFDEHEVVRLEASFSSSGALDDLAFDTAPDAGPFRIVSCSLGCVDGGSGQLSCSQTDVFVNQEIRIGFSEAFDPGTVDSNTFQVVDLSTGAMPPADFSVDPADARTLVYRPRLLFDSAGNPIFGFTDDQAYLLRIPGALLDPLGPYILSTSGEPNQTRLDCVLVASLGVMDANPGNPVATVTVDLVDPASGEIVPDQPAQGATNVSRATDITFAFDDLMNPATLLNPVTGESTTITVVADPDGDPSDVSDQFPIAGSFSIALDPTGPATTVVFDPATDLPPSGGPPDPLVIVVTLSPSIADLAGNPLSGAGPIVFEPEP